MIPNSHPFTGSHWESPAVMADLLSTSQRSIGSVMFTPGAALAAMPTDQRALATGARATGATLCA